MSPRPCPGPPYDAIEPFGDEDTTTATLDGKSVVLGRDGAIR